MKGSSLVTAAVAPEFGGLGVSSLHDLMVGLNRLGRADGSSAIALNMHYAVSAIIGRMARGARERGDEAAAAGLEQFLDRARDRRDRHGERHRVRHRRAVPDDRGDARRRRLASRRSQDLRHALACRRRDGRDMPTSSGRRQLRRRHCDRVPRQLPAKRSSTTGTRSACAPPEATTSSTTTA